MDWWASAANVKFPAAFCGKLVQELQNQKTAVES
jgi:hypothetical protein